MSKSVPALIVILAMILVPGIAFGEASPWTEEDTNSEKIFRKLDFGAKNLLGGWTEIVTVPHSNFKDGESVAKGVAKGIWNAIVYTIGGALHTATFFIPQIDVPLPEQGVQFS